MEKSAVLSMNVTRVVPLSMRVPRVGHSETGRYDAEGEYDLVLRPVLSNTVANSVAARLSMLTMTRVTTGMC